VAFFPDSITEENKYGYFMQDSAITPNYPINILNEVFEDRVVSGRLCPARSPDLNP
jgi:hypothetical protein